MLLASRLASSRVVHGKRPGANLARPWERRASQALSSSSSRWLSSHHHDHHLRCHGHTTPPRSCWWTPIRGLLPRIECQIRGKKTTTVLKMDELPQGVIRADPLPPLSAEPPASPAYPTVILQVRRNMQKFDNCVLLTRVGGFYELYFEHADEVAPLLNLKVAQRKTAVGPVSMAGFPFFQLDRFLKILVQDLNRYVAIAEEFPNDASEKVKLGGLMHDRRVARIITPGTLIDEQFMDPYANNYVMAIHLPAEGHEESVEASESGEPAIESPHAAPADDSVHIGLAWLDLSTGHFFTHATTLASLGSILSRISPREIVLDEDLQSRTGHEVFSILAEDKHLVTFAPRGGVAAISEWAPMLESEIPPQKAEAFTEDEVGAGTLLLHYVKDRLQGICMKLQPPQRYEAMQVMNIDKNSMRALEIKQTIRDSVFRGSLLHAIRRTVTKSGARLLNDWLSAPSTSIDVLRARQDLVACFIADETLREGIILLLRRSHDSQRLVQKFALGRGDPDNLLDLASTIKATEDIVWMLLRSVSSSDAEPAAADRSCLKAMSERIELDSPLKLANKIHSAIDEDSIVQQHQAEESEAGGMMTLAQDIVDAEGSAEDSSLLPKSAKKRKSPPTSIRDHYGEDNEVWIMKPSASRRLARFHAELDGLLAERDALTTAFRERLGAPSLSLKWAPSLGHVAYIKGRRDLRSAETALADLRASVTGRTTASSRSLHLPEWTELGGRLDQVRAQVRAEEQRVFADLRQQTVLNIVKLRRNAAVLDELDIATSFARLALDHGLTRPVLNSGTAHVIVGGRHPTVEGGLKEAGRTFTGNDCFVGSSSSSSSASAPAPAPAHHGRVWLITGPNMAGKSTFLRQNALITILAQVGCYVPASYAEIGIVDAMFSRVGSADNLYRDQSTFMVEMLETATILRQATPRSFVIMDEIGRGTTPEDGCAVAFACLHHLITVNRSRALFATHFHGVADLVAEHGLRIEDPGDQGAVEMYCTDIEEDDKGGFVYVHKLRKGTNRRSHALKVARLAGLPDAALQTAKKILVPQHGS